MTTKQLLLVGLTILSLLILQTASGQNLDTIRIDNKQSILNDRAFFNFPTQAANVKRSVDIMSADPNANVETRIVMDIGTMRLVFFAQELFALADQDLLAKVTKQNEKEQLQTKTLTDKDSLLSVLSTPTKFDSTKSAILVNSLLVRTQDNTLFQINAYINPAAFPTKEQFLRLTENVFSTLSKGTRVNNRAARQEKLEIFATGKAFTVDLPANYAITIDQQYDFQVMKFQKYQPFGDTNWQQMIIYNGHHPSVVYRDFGLKESDGKKIKGSFLGNKVEWLYFDIPTEGVLDKEQLIPSDHIAKGLIVHIAMLSNQDKSITEMTKIVASMKLTAN